MHTNDTSSHDRYPYYAPLSLWPGKQSGLSLGAPLEAELVKYFLLHHDLAGFLPTSALFMRRLPRRGKLGPEEPAYLSDNYH